MLLDQLPMYRSNCCQACAPIRASNPLPDLSNMCSAQFQLHRCAPAHRTPAPGVWRAISGTADQLPMYRSNCCQACAPIRASNPLPDLSNMCSAQFQLHRCAPVHRTPSPGVWRAISGTADQLPMHRSNCCQACEVNPCTRNRWQRKVLRLVLRSGLQGTPVR